MKTFHPKVVQKALRGLLISSSEIVTNNIALCQSKQETAQDNASHRPGHYDNYDTKSAPPETRWFDPPFSEVGGECVTTIPPCPLTMTYIHPLVIGAWDFNMLQSYFTTYFPYILNIIGIG